MPGLATSAPSTTRRPLPLALAALLLLLVTLSAALVQAPPAPVGLPPHLRALAVSAPNKVVAVIVQLTHGAEGTTSAISALGGAVTAELRLINALAVSLPARQLPALAALDTVRQVSLDAPLIDTAFAAPASIPTSSLAVAYNDAIEATKLWNEAPAYLRGDGVGVAIVDSGVNPQEDLYTPAGQNRLVAAVSFQPGYNQTSFDHYGHGNHTAGIVGSSGRRSSYKYIGVAPYANLINVRVLDDNGVGSLSSLIQGLQWIFENHKAYNIRVANISLSSSQPESYLDSPVSAAVEALWFEGIVVVVSAGNGGASALYPPANDPFVITVGATDDRGTKATSDDRMADFSAYGVTSDGHAKPDLVAPGTNIVSLIANQNSKLMVDHPTHMVGQSYFRMSGTSMAAPMVSGAIALLLQDEPQLTPDQVKQRLLSNARAFDKPLRAGAGHLNIYAAVHGIQMGSANQGLQVNRLLAGGSTSLFWNGATDGTVSWRGKGTAFFGDVSWRGKTNGTLATSLVWDK
ncbi:S8 family peptidase [Scytonema tolypothrichoides VB-61278]|nr:S8 family peptidase [Scytonema tolypothrichoides VB-61278]